MNAYRPYTVYIEQAGNWKIFQAVISGLEDAQQRAREVSNDHKGKLVVIYCGQEAIERYRDGQLVNISM